MPSTVNAANANRAGQFRHRIGRRPRLPKHIGAGLEERHLFAIIRSASGIKPFAALHQSAEIRQKRGRFETSTIRFNPGGNPRGPNRPSNECSPMPGPIEMGHKAVRSSP